MGRGGRDGLPCLSVMCVYPEEDLESAFVMTDKVLGSEKILGRWESMLNSHTSTRGIDSYTLVHLLSLIIIVWIMRRIPVLLIKSGYLCNSSVKKYNLLRF